MKSCQLLEKRIQSKPYAQIPWISHKYWKCHFQKVLLIFVENSILLGLIQS